MCVCVCNPESELKYTFIYNVTKGQDPKWDTLPKKLSSAKSLAGGTLQFHSSEKGFDPNVSCTIS